MSTLALEGSSASSTSGRPPLALRYADIGLLIAAPRLLPRDGASTFDRRSFDVAGAVLDEARALGIDAAFQCCEHLNRALAVERATAEKYGLDEVCAVPWPKAGGSCASAAYRLMKEPVLVESIEADAGLDIGCTLIGMHLKSVAIPIRLSMKSIGEAALSAALTRPKLIGGERAHYTL